MAIQVAARHVRSTRPRSQGWTDDDVAARRAARSPARPSTSVVEEVFGQEVRITGPLDVHSVPDVRTALHAALDAGTGDLLVHVQAAVVADATGLGVLVGAHRRAQRLSRRLVLDDVPLATLRLLRVTKLHRVLVLTGDARDRPADRDAPPVADAQNSLPVPSSMPRRAS